MKSYMVGTYDIAIQVNNILKGMNERTYVIRLEGLNTGSKGLSKRQTKGRKKAGVRDGLTKTNGA